MRRRTWIGAGVLGVGLFVSAGSAHAQLTVGPNVNVTKLPGNQREEAIAINPLNPNQMFLATNMEQEGNFAAFSTDGGVTWHSSAGQGDTKPNDFIVGDGNDTLAGLSLAKRSFGRRAEPDSIPAGSTLVLTYWPTRASEVLIVDRADVGDQSPAGRRRGLRRSGGEALD